MARWTGYLCRLPVTSLETGLFLVVTAVVLGRDCLVGRRRLREPDLHFNPRILRNELPKGRKKGLLWLWI